MIYHIAIVEILCYFNIVIGSAIFGGIVMLSSDLPLADITSQYMLLLQIIWDGLPVLYKCVYFH